MSLVSTSRWKSSASTACLSTSINRDCSMTVAWSTSFAFIGGHTFASSALMEPISNGLIADVERFVQRHHVSLITFRKGERKEDIVLPHRLAAKGRERVLVVGKAQEKTPVFRTEKR